MRWNSFVWQSFRSRLLRLAFQAVRKNTLKAKKMFGLKIGFYFHYNSQVAVKNCN